MIDTKNEVLKFKFQDQVQNSQKLKKNQKILAILATCLSYIIADSWPDIILILILVQNLRSFWHSLNFGVHSSQI